MGSRSDRLGALIRMGGMLTVVVYVVVTTVVRVAGAKENWPMVACESRDFGRLRALWPGLLEDMGGKECARMCMWQKGEAVGSLACVFRPAREKGRVRAFESPLY